MSSKTVNELNWMIGGAQGSGVDLSASSFARSCVLAGLWVYGTREYYSNIKGLHSYFEIRTSGRQIRSKVEGVDLLAAFDAETVVRHADAVNPDGGIIYDPAVSRTPIEKVDTLYKDEVRQIQARLTQEGLGSDVDAILEEAKRRGVRLFAIPYGALIQEIAKRLETSELTRLNRIVNVLAVSVSLSLLGLDKRYMEESVRQAFAASRKQKLVEMNLAGVDRAYEFAKEKFGEGGLPVRLAPVQNKPRMFVVGNQAVALGKIAGGCRLQTYYPITPASDESEFLEAHENFDLLGVEPNDGKGSVVVIQTEDEIAAITMAIGGALAGARAATSTSGPGFSLMVEGMGWAGMNEVPVVVTLYQRGGPSTGMPTRTEQGDLKFVLNASHGEFPRIVLCSGDMEECFYDAFSALNYAERYQLPVIHLVDKGLANSNMTILPPDPNSLDIERGKLILTGGSGAPKDGEYRRFAPAEGGISPRAVLGLKGYRFWNTGDEHDEVGHINENSENRIRMMKKRMSKLETADREMPMTEKVGFYAAAGRPDVTLVSWGSSKGAILEGMELLEKRGIKAEFLQIRLASPFPTQAVRERLSEAKLVIDIEQNYSAQMAAVIAEKTQINIKHRIVKFNGRPISRDEIYDSVRQIVARPEANERVILTHGA
ncbi:MAG: 2-oxoacid:acceptor oxidoreductase subunit alpha [Nitrososphaerota archaeon]|nr:2-oxoacid:acceptor oxidoreductase subunit alpha [Nitrososphaerota archaeon]